MKSLARGQEIAQCLSAAGVRATVDPYAVAPPCVLVIPPNLEFDLACGASATWRLVALAPAALTGDRTSWELLDNLVSATAEVVDIQRAELASYVINGKSYPSYLLTFAEGIS